MNQNFRGRWWRFDNYQVGIDDHLIPVSGEKIVEYDPWESYCDWRNDWRDKQPPYMALLDLLHDSAFAHKSSLHALIEASRGREKPLEKLKQSGLFDSIIKWCQQHGVLGILPHQIRRLEYKHEDNQNLRVIQQRVGGSWETLTIEGDKCSLAQTGENLGFDIPEGTWRLVQGEWASLRPGDFSVKPEWKLVDEGAVEKYFPDDTSSALDHGIYPEPLSPWFWMTYGEPILELYDGARILYDCLSTILSEQQNVEKKFLAARRLNILAEPVTHVLSIHPDSRECHLGSPSLLSTYAAMTLMDLAEPNRLFSCDECHRIFASGTSRAAYCSATCRNRYNRRLYRQRQKNS